MVASRSTWWQLAKVVLAVAVVVCVGWQFAGILTTDGVWDAGLSVHPAGVAASAVLYLAGLGCCAVFWHLLLRALGQQPRLPDVLRAFYVGQLGRYVPGKVVGLYVRARLLSGPGVGQRVAVLTVVCESLAMLTAGGLLAAVWLPLRGSDLAGLRWWSLGLLVVLGVPLFPGVFNRLVRRVAPPPQGDEDAALPPVRARILAEGLGIEAAGWLLQGLSLWALVEALVPGALPWTVEGSLDVAAAVALAMVAGFVILLVPGGLGVRELILQQLLAADLAAALGPERAAATAVVAVLLLRLVWMVAELTTAGVLYLMPTSLRGLSRNDHAEFAAAAACQERARSESV
jgi:uncharacterized membrane protein YbhN (UPF0104 family)